MCHGFVYVDDLISHGVAVSSVIHPIGEIKHFESFNARKLCRRVSSRDRQFYSKKTAKYRFGATRWEDGLEVTNAIHI